MTGDLYTRPVMIDGEILIYEVRKNTYPFRNDNPLFRGTYEKCEEFRKQYNKKRNNGATEKKSN